MATKPRKRSSGGRKKAKKTYKATGRGRTIRRSATMTGRSETKRDGRRSALSPGKRVSAKGRVYHERRANRSDVDPRKRL